MAGLICLFICQPGLKAQLCNLTVRGIILDEHDTTALSYANIAIEGSDKIAQADSSGYYEIQGLCPGTYTFICSHIDCTPVKKRMTIGERFTELNFYPEHHVRELKQIVIRARSNHEVTSVRASIDAEQLTSLKTSSLSQSLRTLPGISVLSTGNNIEKPLIHGLYGSRIAIVQQASKLEDQQWGNEHAPSIDVLMFDKIEVIKGAASVRYGSKALAGAVILEQGPLYKQKEARHTLVATLQSNSPGLAASSIIEKGLGDHNNAGWKLGLGVQKNGDFMAPAFVLSNTGNTNLNGAFSIGKTGKKWDTRVTLTSRYTRSGLLLASQIHNQNDLERAIGSDRPLTERPWTLKIQAPCQEVIHSSAIYNGSYRWKEDHKIKINASYQHNNRKEFDVRRGGRTDIPAVNMNLHTGQIEVADDHQWDETWSGSIGLTLLAQINQNVPNTQRRPIIPYYTLINPGIFVFQQANFDRITLEGGVRLDHQALDATYYDITQKRYEPHRKFTNGVASGGFSTVLWHQVNVRVNAGMAYRAPDVNELYSNGVHLSSASYEVGDPGLTAERSFKWITEISNDKDRQLNYSVSLFHQSFKNYIYQKPNGYVSTIAGLKLRYDYVQALAELIGSDAWLNYRINPWATLQARASWIEGTNKETGKGIPLIPPFAAGAGLEIRLYKDKKSGKEGIFKVDADHTGRQKRYNAEELFRDPPGSYTLVNISLKIKGKNSRNTYELKCNNVFNTAYSNYLNNLRYFAPQEAGRNIICQYIYNF